MGASPEQATVGNTLSQDALTKADKLEIAYVRDVAATEPTTLATKAPVKISPQPLSSIAPPEIVSRHWRDPNTKKSAVSPGRRIKSQEVKKSKNVDRGKATVDLRVCRTPQGFAGLLRALNRQDATRSWRCPN